MVNRTYEEGENLKCKSLADDTTVTLCVVDRFESEDESESESWAVQSSLDVFRSV